MTYIMRCFTYDTDYLRTFANRLFPRAVMSDLILVATADIRGLLRNEVALGYLRREDCNFGRTRDRPNRMFGLSLTALLFTVQAALDSRQHILPLFASRKVYPASPLPANVS